MADAAVAEVEDRPQLEVVPEAPAKKEKDPAEGSARRIGELQEANPAQFRHLPWDQIAAPALAEVNVEEMQTSEEILRTAGLDWGVGIRPLWRKLDSGEMVQARRNFETYRLDDEEQLGTVRSKYKLFTNVEAFAFADTLVQDGTAHWVDAGERGHGRQVWMTMKFNEGFQVGGEDAYDLYAFFRTSHDGSTGVQASVIPFRPFCLNQQQLIVASAKARWSVTHTTDVAARIDEARKSLELTRQYAPELEKVLEKLMAKKISEARIKTILEKVLTEGRTRREEVVADVMHVYQHSPTVEPYKGTAYGALNAVTEYFDHYKRQRNDGARFDSIMTGEGAKVRNEFVQFSLN
jgi:phage/plasmid-like protein (TIGR03299 family)